MISAVGLFNVILCTSSRMLYAMAPEDMLDVPALAHLHPKYHTPVWSLVFNSLGVALFIFLPFQQLVQIDNLLYSLSLLLEFGALVWLRIKEPDTERPYRIPLGTKGLIAFSVPPCLLCLLSVFYTLLYSNFTVILISSLVIGLGILLFISNHSQTIP